MAKVPPKEKKEGGKKKKTGILLNTIHGQPLKSVLVLRGTTDFAPR